MTRKRIAKITSTMLGYEDHGVFTAYLMVDYGGACQGIGGFCLDRYDRPTDARMGTKAGLDFVIGVMKACGVEKWEAITGRTIFVLLEDESWNVRPIGLENLPTERGCQFLFEPWSEQARAEQARTEQP